MSFLTDFSEFMNDNRNKYIRNFQSFLRRKSDQEIKNALRNMSQSKEAYQYVYAEAKRRGIV